MILWSNGLQSFNPICLFVIAGDKLIYLDPHTTQLCDDLDSPDFPDDSYHCSFPSTMNVLELDPSIALVWPISYK